MTEQKKKGWFRTALDKYDAFLQRIRHRSGRLPELCSGGEI